MWKISALFIFTLIVGVAPGQAIPKRARIFLQDVPQQFHRLLASELQRQQVPLRLVEDRAEAQFLMTAELVQRERQLQAVCRLTSATGRVSWSAVASDKVEKEDETRLVAEQKVARRLIRKLVKHVQGHETSESRFHTWWPSVDEVKRRDEVEREERPQVLYVRRHIPKEVDVHWKDDRQAEEEVPQITVGMTTDEVEAIFGVPQRIARVGNRLVYRYPEMVVEFLSKKVSTVRF